MTHNKHCPSIEGSRRFLVSYVNSLHLIKQFPEADIIKGKMVVDELQGLRRGGSAHGAVTKPKQKWVPPGQGEAKLNVDGAFTTNDAGTGMILRDDQGAIIFAACRALTYCRDATEAEILAIAEGLKLALHWTNKNLVIETDCTEAVHLISEDSANTSVYAFRISEIREMLRERRTRLVSISRDANGAAHELAKLSRLKAITELWLSSCPPEAGTAVELDCNMSFSY
jgi:ribonuclease HI